jgi:uncharacterized membrane protein
MIKRALGWLEDRHTLGLVLLALWAVYFIAITLGNFTELLWSFGWIDPEFRSGNLHWVTVTTEIYVDSEPLDQLLLAGAIAFEALGAVLLCRAAVLWAKRATTALAASRAALLVGTAVWLVYAISVEATVSYQRGQNEQDYWVICGSSLATILVLALVARPSETSETDPASG